MLRKNGLVGRMVLGALTVSCMLLVTACGAEKEMELDIDTSKFEDADAAADAADIDIEKFKEAAGKIGELDLNTDVNLDLNEYKEDEEAEESEEHYSGEKTVYSYTDVYRDGNDITVVPNGGMNEFTVLTNGKDLDGFLDYIDSVVLEEGRTINREMFYDLLAIMLVDEDLSPSFEDNEKNIIMALAMANNFHDMDIKINDCHLDANNASEYKYHMTVSGNDNTWIVDYGKRTVYFNDGATEYSSDMFRDDYLAVWLTAVEEYYM